MTDTLAPPSTAGHPVEGYDAARLRWATIADAPRLTALWGEAYPEDPTNVADMVAWLEYGGAMLLQDSTGRVVAAQRWREEGRGWRVDRVATRPEDRGQGYGRWLATKVEALAIRQNVAHLLLALPSDDDEQLAYYVRMGYEVVDEPAAAPNPGANDGARTTLRKIVGGVWQTKATPLPIRPL